jgi:hypothetical protein
MEGLHEDRYFPLDHNLLNVYRNEKYFEQML